MAAKKWDGAVESLKFDARAAANEGAPGLYAALFGRSRPKPKAAATPGNAPPAATSDTTAVAKPDTTAPVVTPDATAPAAKTV